MGLRMFPVICRCIFTVMDYLFQFYKNCDYPKKRRMPPGWLLKASSKPQRQGRASFRVHFPCFEKKVCNEGKGEPLEVRKRGPRSRCAPLPRQFSGKVPQTADKFFGISKLGDLKDNQTKFGKDQILLKSTRIRPKKRHTVST